MSDNSKIDDLALALRAPRRNGRIMWNYGALREAVSRGMTTREIAAFVGCSAYPVDVAIRRLGIKRPIGPRAGRWAGAKNAAWKGGRSIASNGYVLIRVGAAHHLADVRGYAYEHRLVAERKAGRRLRPGEIVHHINGDKQDNHPQNLAIVNGNAEHQVHHRTNRGRDLRLPGEANPLIRCECGCGESFTKYDPSGRPRRFVSGHNLRKATANV